MSDSVIIGEEMTFFATIDKENPTLVKKKEVKWAYQLNNGPFRYFKNIDAIIDGYVDDKGRIAIDIAFDEEIFKEELAGKTIVFTPYFKSPDKTREEAKITVEVLPPLTTHYIYYPFGVAYKGYPVAVQGAESSKDAYTETFGLDDLQQIDWKDYNPGSNRFLKEFEASDATATNPEFWGGLDLNTDEDGKIMIYEGEDAQFQYQHFQDRYRGEARPKTDPEPCCDGLKKFFKEVLNKAWGKITKDFDPYSDSYWYGDDGYTYFVTDKDEFYKIKFDSYEKVDELPPMLEYIEMMLPSTAATKGITIMGGKAGKTTMVYFAKQGGKIIYVGITNNFARRSMEHLRGKLGIPIQHINKNLDKLSLADAKAVEQVLIEYYGLGKNGGSLVNRINSIANKNPVYAKSIQKGMDILKEIGFKF